jgi:transposase InsO family protein
VAIKYFTRWIEAKPLAKITSKIVKKFFWQNIVYRFDVPRTLTLYNGKPFDSKTFKAFCQSIGTRIAFTSVYHPESNGAIEIANRILFSTISKMLFNLCKGKWVEELPKVTWSHNTNVSIAIGHPFQVTLWRRGNATRRN